MFCGIHLTRRPLVGWSTPPKPVISRRKQAQATRVPLLCLLRIMGCCSSKDTCSKMLSITELLWASTPFPKRKANSDVRYSKMALESIWAGRPLSLTFNNRCCLYLCTSVFRPAHLLNQLGQGMHVRVAMEMLQAMPTNQLHHHGNPPGLPVRT